MSDTRAVRVPFAGSKAARLACAAAAGLPVLPGFVVPYDEGADNGENARSGEGAQGSSHAT